MPGKEVLLIGGQSRNLSKVIAFINHARIRIEPFFINQFQNILAMTTPQNTWTNYISLFPIGHQVVIQSLRTTYKNEYAITEFKEFERRLVPGDLLFEELSHLPVDTEFILSLGQWMKEKSVGLRDWGEYPGAFEDFERPFAIAIMDYYKNRPIEEFRDLSDISVAKDLVFSLPVFNRDFWRSYAKILVDRYLELTKPLSIIQQPQDVSGCPGNTVIFTVLTEPAEVTRQWRKNGKNIIGATQKDYHFEVVSGDNHAEISVLVSNGTEAVLSEPATITVDIPEILQQPQDVSTQVGSEVVLSILTAGEGITFQWRKGSIPLEGKNKAALTLGNVQLKDIGQYDCVVSSPCQTIISEKAILTVLDSYIVKGKIIKADRSPAVNCNIKAYHYDQGQKYLLGSVQTNSDGNYAIPFTSEQFGLEWKGKANLYILATSQEVSQRSPLILGANTIQVINMILSEKTIFGINEYIQLKEWFDTNSPTFDWANVKEQDVETFSKRSKFPQKWIKAYSQAKFIASSPENVEGYYGVIRTKIGFSQKDFLNLKPEETVAALTLAKKRNFISLTFNADNSFTNTLNDEFVSGMDSLIEASTDNDIKKFVDLVDFGTAPLSTKRKFFELYRQNRESATSFWKAIDRELSEFSERLKLISQIGAITSSNLPLMSEISSAHTFSKAQELVQLTESDLETDIQNAGDPIPPYIKGQTMAEKRTNYARWISGQLEESFPTPYMRARIAEDSRFPSQGDFGVFFGSNSMFELGKEPVHQYLSNNPDALSGIFNPEVFTKDLLKLQRFHTIAPREQKAKTTAALFAHDFQSAPHIASTPYQTFISTVSNDIGEEVASQVYASAREVTGRAINFAGKYNQGLNAVEFQVVRGNALSSYNQEIRDIFPDIETLLGETDYCACEHCKSIFGPAAYLVDLLRYCQNIATDEFTLYELLTKVYGGLDQPRRGDMPKIDLDCDNTNVPLPEIDIVNELLCDLVDESFPDARQTTWTAEELRIAPEYPPTSEINTKLSSNQFPWTLPFDYFSESVNLQLPMVGASREEIAWKLPKEGGNPVSDEEIKTIRAIGILGISEVTWLRLKMEEFDINTTYDVTGSVSDYFEDAGGNLLVKKLIDHVGISFDRFRALLNTATLNPYQSDGTHKYSIFYTGEGCSLEDARISGIEDFYNRFYYLEKLYSSLDWELPVADLFVRGNDLQDYIDTPNPARLGNTLLEISLLKLLSQKLKRDFSSVISWFTILNTTTYQDGQATQFEDIYLNSEVGYTYTDSERTGLELNEERTGIAAPEPLGTMKNAILSSLQLSEEDLDLLVNSGWLGGNIYDIDANLPRLTYLYLYSELMDALDLGMSELLTLWKCFSGSAEFPISINYEIIEQLLEFVDFVQQIRKSAFSNEELISLFTSKNLEPILPVAKITIWLNQFRDILKKQWQQNLDNLKETQPGIHFLLATQTIDAVTADDFKNIDTLVRGEYDQPTQTALISWWDQFALANATNIDKTEFIEQVIDTSVPTYKKDIKERIVKIYETFSDAQQIDPGPSLLETVFTNYLNQFALQEFVSHFLGPYPKVSPLQNQLLTDTDYLQNPNNVGEPLLNVFTSKIFVESSLTIDPENFPNEYHAYRLLFKNLLFLSKFEHIDQYYPLFYTHRPMGWPEPAHFPIGENFSLMSGLLEVWKLREVEKSLSLKKSELFLMLLQAKEGTLGSLGEVQDRVSTLTGWPLSEVEHLTGTTGFNFTGSYYLQSEWISTLHQAFETAQKLTVLPSMAQGWNKETILKSDASAIQQAVRKQFTGGNSTDKLVDANDQLREALRDALLGYVLHKTSVLDGGLFEKSQAGMSDFLLIDIKRSACGLTSRIKQALSAIQMLLQRALLGLERLPGTPSTFEVPTGAAKEWVWRKNYRVWEANRKIFMYPENWLLNETRDDQTQLYQTFVSELSQSNITDESARRAVTNYLRSLSEISDLEIAQIYQERDDINLRAAKGSLTDTVHIFARTKGSPHRYYYRKWVDDAYFTPWEELPFEIEGNHLIPTQYAGRLWLFWPIFIEKGEEDASVNTDIPSTNYSGTFSSTPPQPKKYFEIRIAWTTAFRGQWQPKKISKKTFIAKNPLPVGEDFKEMNFYFYTAISDDNNLILTPVVYPSGNQQSGSASPVGEYMKFTGSTSQPELIEEAELPSYFLLPNGDQFNMKNAFTSDEAVPRFSSGSFAGDATANRMVTSVSPSLVTLPQQFPNGSPLSNYAFFFEDQKRSFLANPEVAPPDVLTVSMSTLDATGTLIDRAMSSGDGQLFSGTTNLAPRTQGKLENGPSENIYYGSGDENNTVVITGNSNTQGRTWWIDQPVESWPPTPEDSYTPLTPSHRFYAHYHPYAEDFYREVNHYGLEGIYQPIQENLKRQLALSDFDFEAIYDPSSGVINKYPIENIDFTSFGAYSVYNWELFLHIPMSVAQMLTSNYRFAEAQQWLHYIFDPTESEGTIPERFWKIKPLYEFSILDSAVEFQNFVEGQDENLQKLIKLWEKDPFNPHLIARFRISTYMRRVIMMYIENLLAWADQLFAGDSIESINEAFQLYMLAWRILGERPQKLPPKERVVKNINELIGTGSVGLSTLAQLSDGLTTHIINTSVNFNTSGWRQSAPKLNQFPNISESMSRAPVTVPPVEGIAVNPRMNQLGSNQNLVQSASQLSESASIESVSIQREVTNRYNPAADQFAQAAEAMNTLGYFCVLPNTQMYEYWNTVEDRLYKIRHCLNLEGEERSLSLYEPPIDPGAIIAALASGQSLSSAINGLIAPLPYYRFRYLIDRSLTLVQEVKGLGQSMLAALEKADGKELALLREQHQENVLDAVRQVKIKAVEAAEASLLALQAQRENVKYREQFYRSRKFTITEEDNYIKSIEKANSLNQTAGNLNLIVGVLSAIPGVSLGINGAFGSPHAATDLNGYNFSAATKAASQALEFAAGIARNHAGIQNTKGSWIRRENNWIFQAESAKKELSQIDKLIEAANIRFEMAQRELEAHDRQIVHSIETQQVIDTQFGNRDLYMWMRSELSSLYRTAYNEALTLAKQTEQCFRFELWPADFGVGYIPPTYITSDHWNGLKKGLLSGEKLERQLRNMQKSYDDQNERLFELKKNISLSEIDPGALLKLKRTGKTAFSISEFLFDLDYAGQYQRRIKSVSITIPCVAGPYGNITARLSLTGNLVRKEASMVDGYDSNFIDGISPSQALATTIGTSSANRDSGLFQLNFNDERYLPFEGAGVKSDWVLELPTVYEQFDYDSISDVILHIDYTARENTGTFKEAVTTYIQENLNEGIGGGWNELISLKPQFSDAFYKFLHPAPEQTNMETEFVITNKQFPYIFNGLETKITEMTLLIRLKDRVDVIGNAINMKLGKTDNLPGYQTMQFGDNNDDKTYHLLYCSFDYSTAPITGHEKNLTLRKTSDVSDLITAGKVEDILLLVSFEKM